MTEVSGGALPPGQRRIEGFPRFGASMSGPPPAVPADPAITIGGAGVDPVTLPVAALADLPRRELTADFHCVTGWSATGLRWGGVAFADVFGSVVGEGTPVTHLVFRGLDRYWSVATLADVLAADVLLADHLDGRPLDGDHGAPVRLVSPGQYGYVNTKHLCRIDLHAAEPRDLPAPLRLRLLGPHPRARVWAEERHRHLPAWSVRRAYRASIGPLLRRGARG